MNENPLPPAPENQPLRPPKEPPPVVRGVVKAGQAGLGGALFVISCASGAALHALPVPVLGLMAAIGSLFFDGYRYIFVGYVLTALILVGLALLLFIAICGHVGAR